VLRLLAEYGIFEVRMGSFGHTTSSRLLRSDHPQSLRSFVRMMGLPVYWRTWEFFEQSVRTGAAAAAQVMPEGPWQYLQDHPADARIFADAMSAKSHAQIPAILRSYDISQFSRIADIGGGHGHLLRAALDRAPNAVGVLFDLPQGLEGAARNSSTRMQFQPGNFFTDALPICDCYLLMHVLHDWDDERALEILRAIRRSSPPNAVLLVIESIVPIESVPTWERILDLHMLAIYEGRERTVCEYAKLLSTAGFRHQQTIDTQAGVWILEARPTGGRNA
jgi:SAM-dependent methyltransferase